MRYIIHDNISVNSIVKRFFLKKKDQAQQISKRFTFRDILSL